MDKMSFRSRIHPLPVSEADVERCGLFTEEQLVDFVMGQLIPEDQASVQQHRSQCPNCDAMIREWSELLVHDSQRQSGSGTPAPPHPRRSLRLRLMASFRLRSLRHKWAVNRSRYIGRALGGITALFLIYGLLVLSPQGWPGGEGSRLERDISHQIHLIQSADTEQYAINPHPPYYGEGMVWLKRESGEMLIVVDGLHSVVEKDYQIWLQMDDGASSPGLLPVRHPVGKSYYHGYGFGDVERLVISLEPKGGSRVQTGPEAVWVEMKR